MANEPPPPDVLSLIVCDQIINDRMTGKHSLIGMFSRVHARAFPATHPQICIFASLTDGHGKVDLTIRIVDANEARKPIIEGKGRVEFKDPRAVACLNLHFNGLVFPEPGGYRVQLKCHGELLREARLYLSTVRRLKGGGGPAKPQGPK
ncbi:MAG: hypothetical protein IIA33_11630 [Planctomycetes bacterium]|nr:hypothetical protein [Planctomycetota bacterium]